MGAVTTVRLSVYEEETKKFLVGGDVLGAPFVGAVSQKSGGAMQFREAESAEVESEKARRLRDVAPESQGGGDETYAYSCRNRRFRPFKVFEVKELFSKSSLWGSKGQSPLEKPPPPHRETIRRGRFFRTACFGVAGCRRSWR